MRRLFPARLTLAHLTRRTEQSAGMCLTSLQLSRVLVLMNQTPHAGLDWYSRASLNARMAFSPALSTIQGQLVCKSWPWHSRVQAGECFPDNAVQKPTIKEGNFGSGFGLEV